MLATLFPPSGQKKVQHFWEQTQNQIQNKPSIHENMKIHFTIVSIKKHEAPVYTVESSLNYRTGNT